MPQQIYCPVCRKVQPIDVVIVDTSEGKFICQKCTGCQQILRKEQPFLAR